MRRRTWIGVTTLLLSLLVGPQVSAATYYVAPDGSDSAAGSETAPFATWAKAQSTVAAGDTVYFRGGRYVYKDATSTCSSATATINAVVLSKSGTSGNPINYFAYPGEKPVFDFSGISDTSQYSCRQTGVRVTASWLHLKGLEFTGALQLNNQNHESWGVYIYGGSNNVFEQLDSHHNMGPGFFLQRGGNNLFLNCDSHENEDTLTSNGDGQSADGFGCHPNQTGDTGNVFRGCRAWWNTDDGWDFINATEACTVEYSWSWYNGYKPDAISGGAPVTLSSGNGNGFKGGGYGMPPSGVPSPVPQHVLRFNVAFYNKAAGFYANHSPNNAYFYNNTSFHNSPDFNLLGVASDGSTSTSVGILRNNLAYSGSLTSNATLGGSIDDQFNSWDTSLGITVAAADFQSTSFAPPASCPAAYAAGGTVCVPATDTTSFAGMASARQADGSLPALPFLHLAASSQVIDKGTDIGFAFNGKAPDLGAFEYGGTVTTGTGGASGTGGTSGAGGASGTGGATGSGGARTGGASGSSGASGGGGAGPSGGATGTGGAVTGTGGARTGGATSIASGGAGGGADGGPATSGGTTGSSASGGATSATGGARTGGATSVASGGAGGTTNPTATGGAAAGGATTSTVVASGGTTAASGGTTGAATGGAAGTTTTGTGQSGCGCHLGGREMPPAVLPLLTLLGLLLRRRR